VESLCDQRPFNHFLTLNHIPLLRIAAIWQKVLWADVTCAVTYPSGHPAPRGAQFDHRVLYIIEIKAPCANAAFLPGLDGVGGREAESSEERLEFGEHGGELTGC
jgi:hypothetical protein